MQQSEFTYVLQHPQAITAQQTEQLKALVDEHPYFQSARALYLKGLKKKESYKYNNALKVTAAHTTDRSVLFDYITSEVFNQNAISESIKQNSEYLKNILVNEVDDISVDKSVKIDDALKQQIQDTKGVLDPNLFEEKSKTLQTIASTSKPKTEITASPEDLLSIGKPLSFDKSETHSFSEWLKLTTFKPIDRTSDAQPSAPLDTKLELIDRFLTSNPKIKPTENAPKPKLVNNEDTVEESVMTETLARIYLEQKNYDKAIQSYKILSLKYPEKSGFFADQIKAVEALKSNNKD
ncbi:hypothetical protein Q2T40_14685 [Winogradskyella maritima]|uniref:Tetratricopeptide repeat protein n=1 Tax=Winogradskyella maritima TaxID=1517766 RepID=A0ABV8AHX8_9FLAO|nr:hypothetical protein [Winogradskyella maritima]